MSFKEFEKLRQRIKIHTIPDYEVAGWAEASVDMPVSFTARLMLAIGERNTVAESFGDSESAMWLVFAAT